MNTKKYLFILMQLCLANFFYSNAQITGTDYKVINIPSHGYGSYAKSVIILHEIYDGVLLSKNFVVGEIVALRGGTTAYDRTNTAFINTSSAYSGIKGHIESTNSDAVPWKLKIVTYNSKKYLAAEVPYSAAHHDIGFKFKGWARSSGESLLCVAYEDGGSPVNVGILTIDGDFEENMINFYNGTMILNESAKYGGDYETSNNNYKNVLAIGGYGAEKGLKIYKQNPGESPSFVGPYSYNDTYVFEMTDSNEADPDGGIVFGETGDDNDFNSILTIRGNGKVGIGTTNPYYKFDVEGTIRAHEIKVNLNTGADFVFEGDYNLMPLNELESFVKTQKHLPEVAPAKEMEAEGLSVSEMNIKLLQKIEELTLYVIDMNKELQSVKEENKILQEKINVIETKKTIMP